MKDSTIRKLIKSARKTFIIELENKINDMDALLTRCETVGCTENEALKLLRFFHSVNGTASTLGMERLSSLAGRFEALLKEQMERGESLERPFLEFMHSEIIRMRKYTQLSEQRKIKGITATQESEENRVRPMHDSLTGAYSRYCFNLRIQEELERSKRTKQLFSIVSIKLDSFSVLNDRYGYQAGELVLQKFVAFLKKHLRKYDSLFRLWGEKFVIFLPNTDELSAFKIIERLQEGLSKFPFEAGGDEITVTFSAGIACTSGEDVTEKQLIGYADQAMHLARKNGARRVVVYGKDTENLAIGDSTGVSNHSDAE